MLRLCTHDDQQAICDVINDGARAYRGVIPSDRWHDPYMPLADLKAEVSAGVEFWGSTDGPSLVGVMGIQPKHDVTLIRHAYVRSTHQGQGIGTRLLQRLRELTEKPILIGTWLDATWALHFYQRHGFQQVSLADKNRLLKRYWTVPDRQIETSVVLADQRWHDLPHDRR